MAIIYDHETIGEYPMLGWRWPNVPNELAEWLIEAALLDWQPQSHKNAANRFTLPSLLTLLTLNKLVTLQSTNKYTLNEDGSVNLSKLEFFLTRCQPI